MKKNEMNEIWRLMGTYRGGDPKLRDQRLLEAWYMTLAPYRFEDVKGAVVSHFGNNNFWPNISEITKHLPQAEGSEKRKYEPPTPSEQRSREKLLAWQKEFHAELRGKGLPTFREALERGMTPGEWNRALMAAGVWG